VICGSLDKAQGYFQKAALYYGAFTLDVKVGVQ